MWGSLKYIALNMHNFFQSAIYFIFRCTACQNLWKWAFPDFAKCGTNDTLTQIAIFLFFVGGFLLLQLNYLYFVENFQMRWNVLRLTSLTFSCLRLQSHDKCMRITLDHHLCWYFRIKILFLLKITFCASQDSRPLNSV